MMISAESAGMSKRLASPVDFAELMPVLIEAAQVSKAAVPGRPGVSLIGNASLMKRQMSMLMLRPPPPPPTVPLLMPSDTLSK